jgi:hypothetical protein
VKPTQGKLILIEEFISRKGAKEQRRKESMKAENE